MKTSICFYSGVRHPKDFNTYPWYETDVQILRSLGYDVYASRRRFDISLRSHLYLAWWPTSGMLPMTVAKTRRKPFLLIAGGDDVVTQFPNFGYWERSPVVRRMIKATVTRADHVIAVSQHAAEQVKALGAPRVSVVYNAINVEMFSPGTVGNLSNGGRDFLCIVAQLNGYYLRRKPIETLIKALPKVLARHPATRLLIIGRQAEGYSELQSLAASLGVSNALQFLGQVTPEEKLQRLRSAFAYVQPTTHEAFGVAIAEAMSCGVPVVTSPVAAVPEVVGDCGLFADPHDPEAFSKQMLYLLDNPDSAAELGRRARERVVGRFSVAERRRGLETLLSQVAL